MSSIKMAIRHLKRADPELIDLFQNTQIDELTRGKNYFNSLCRSIVFQQLSGKAAKTIFDRFKNLYLPSPFPEPEDILNSDKKRLRSVGLSMSKIGYLKNLSQSFIQNKKLYKNFGKQSNNQIIDLLTEIKGIGPWSVQMFLIFTLNRLDVFPSGDLGVRKGYQFYFNLDRMPTNKEMITRAQKWKPFRTYVSLHFWKILEGPFDW
tara:strand:+ start:352 stop:969 length:618 start_codon:yes stop_codon:yes gene_type:complete